MKRKTSEGRTRENTDRKDGSPFAETDEYGHGRNAVAQAEKQAASQETAGLLDPQ